MDRQLLVREATSLILKHASPRRIFLYGSEATGEATSTSDIDIAFDGDATDDMEAIESEISALPTLVRIDVKNLASCEERFVNRVKETGRVLYSADKKLRFEDGLYNFTRAFEKFDALANSNCHARMLLSGIHDFSRLQSGFPPKIIAGMTICDAIKFDSAVKSSEKFIADGYGDIYLDFVGLVCKNPRSCFKEAFAQGLIDDEPLWLDMIEMRNRSSHIYNEQEIHGILDKLEWYDKGFGKLKSRLERELAEA